MGLFWLRPSGHYISPVHVSLPRQYEFPGSGWVGYGIVLPTVVEVLEHNGNKRYIGNLNFIK